MEFMQIINCLIQVFMGAVSGYYTNKLAISHLFTDIPLINGTWRAVIKKGGNKERLAEDLSELAEDKIIGKQTEDPNAQNSYLYQELSRPDVLLVLDQCVDGIFQELEKSSIGQQSLAVLLGDYLKEDQSLYKLLEELLLKITADWEVQDFISKETFLTLFRELWEKELAPKLSEEQALQLLIDDICRELSESDTSITIEAVFGRDFCIEAEEVLLKKIGEILDDMEHDRARMRMEGYLHSICRQLGMEAVLRRFFLSLREKKLGEMISIPGETWFSETLCVLLEQPKIQENLQILFDILKGELVQADWKLSDLLPEGCLESEAVLEALKGQIKRLQPFIGSLYEDNQEFISERIAKELTAVIEEGTGNFLQNMVLFSAKDMILLKMQEFLKEKLPGKIEGFLEEPPYELCMELSHALGELSVSSLTQKLSFDIIFNYLKQELQQGHSISNVLMEKAEYIPMSFFLTDELIDSIAKKADKFLLLFVSEWLKGEKKKEQTERVVSSLLESLWKKPLQKKELEALQKGIKKLSLPEKLFAWLDKWIGNTKQKEDTEQEGYIKQEEPMGLDLVYEKLSKKKIRDFLVPAINNIDAERKELFFQTVVKKYNDSLTVRAILSAIPKEPLKKKIRALFTQNASRYLSIKPIVRKRILALDEDMLCAMMQKFMGTQLRPLNRIGGALGAMVGLLLWFLNPTLEMSLPMAVLFIVCYAFIGIGTNILALHGLFRPYHPKERRWLKHFAGQDENAENPVMAIYHFLSKIPGIRNLFCLGYIPEKKDQIARQLSSFVADNFLKPEELLPEINIKPEMVQGFLEKHKETMAEHAVKKLWEMDWEASIKQLAKKTLAQKGSGQAIISWLYDRKEIETKEIETKGSSFLAKELFPVWQSIQERPLQDFINSKQSAEKMTAFLLGQAEHIGADQEKFAGFLQTWYKKTWQEKTIGSFLPKDQQIIAAQKIANAFSDMLYYGDNVSLWAKNFILKVLSSSSDQCISELFDGKLGEAVENNLDSLELFFFQMLKQGCYRYLSSHEEELVDKIDLEIQAMMDTMASMPLGEMAASMLGTKQLIKIVFHRLFIEPPVSSIQSYHESYDENEDSSEDLSEECYQKEEFVIQERLSDELFDRNEAVFLEKIQEIIKTQILTLTIERLQEILFAAAEGEQAKEHWADSLCARFVIWKQCRNQSLEPIQQMVETLFALTETITVGEVMQQVHSTFLEEVFEQEIRNTIIGLVQKPSMKQACMDCFEYLFTTYLLSERLKTCLPVITEDFLAVTLQNNWKQWFDLPCIHEFLSEIFNIDFVGLLHDQESGLSILINETCDSLQKKEGVQEGCQEFLEKGIEILSELYAIKPLGAGAKQIHLAALELLHGMNDAFQYQREHRAGLFKVAETVDFAKIIYLAVMDMTDAQIEELFKGFAGQYFLSLKLSGALGFVFGVPVIQWIAVLVVFGGGLIEKKKEE